MWSCKCMFLDCRRKRQYRRGENMLHRERPSVRLRVGITWQDLQHDAQGGEILTFKQETTKLHSLRFWFEWGWEPSQTVIVILCWHQSLQKLNWFCGCEEYFCEDVNLEQQIGEYSTYAAALRESVLWWCVTHWIYHVIHYTAGQFKTIDDFIKAHTVFLEFSGLVRTAWI